MLISLALPATGFSARFSSLVPPHWQKFHVPPPDGGELSDWSSMDTAVVALPCGSCVVMSILCPRIPPPWLTTIAAAFMPCRKASPLAPLAPLTAAIASTLNGTELAGGDEGGPPPAPG